MNYLVVDDLVRIFHEFSRQSLEQCVESVIEKHGEESQNYLLDNEVQEMIFDSVYHQSPLSPSKKITKKLRFNANTCWMDSTMVALFGNPDSPFIRMIKRSRPKKVPALRKYIMDNIISPKSSERVCMRDEFGTLMKEYCEYMGLPENMCTPFTLSGKRGTNDSILQVLFHYLDIGYTYKNISVHEISEKEIKTKEKALELEKLKQHYKSKYIYDTLKITNEELFDLAQRFYNKESNTMKLTLDGSTFFLVDKKGLTEPKEKYRESVIDFLVTNMSYTNPDNITIPLEELKEELISIYAKDKGYLPHTEVSGGVYYFFREIIAYNRESITPIFGSDYNIKVDPKGKIDFRKDIQPTVELFLNNSLVKYNKSIIVLKVEDFFDKNDLFEGDKNKLIKEVCSERMKIRGDDYTLRALVVYSGGHFTSVISEISEGEVIYYSVDIMGQNVIREIGSYGKLNLHRTSYMFYYKE